MVRRIDRASRGPRTVLGGPVPGVLRRFAHYRALRRSCPATRRLDSCPQDVGNIHGGLADATELLAHRASAVHLRMPRLADHFALKDAGAVPAPSDGWAGYALVLGVARIASGERVQHLYAGLPEVVKVACPGQQRRRIIRYPGTRNALRAAVTCSRTTQPSTWSLTSPIACMNA